MAARRAARQTSALIRFVMVPTDALETAVRTALTAGGGYLSASQILERVAMRDELIAECGSKEKAVQRVKDVLLKSLQGELSFDFTPNGRKRDLMGSPVAEVTIVFKLRG
jgi:hypothetical protein